jgi:hypothetical protein
MRPAEEDKGIGIVEILRHLVRNKMALGLIFFLLGLIVAEFAWDDFRESFSAKHPLTIGVISSFLFIALGTIAVDLYLRERDRKQRQLEIIREREAWDPSARRIFEELQSALGSPSMVVIDALLALTQPEAGVRKPDPEEIAKSLDGAVKPVRAVLNQQLSLMLLRPELVEAARRAEEAAEAVETAAAAVRDWNFDEPEGLALQVTIEYLSEREQWFVDRTLEDAEEVLDQVSRSMET